MSDELQQNTNDYVVSVAKAVLGMVPFAGSLLAELAGTVIPNQRIERLASFARLLEQKVAGLDTALLRSKLTDENFTDLVEETARHAARAVTQERREYLASLLASGMSEDKVSFVQSKHMLRILGELNDIEVIWLRFYLYPYMNGDNDFRETHTTVLEPILATIGSGQETIDQHALQENYVQHLVSLGLLERQLHIESKTGQPVFDKFKGGWKTKSPQVTPLGRLLLRHIGLSLATNSE